MPVFYHRLALAELKNAVRWYARAGAKVANRFLAQVHAATSRVEANPSVGSPCYGAYRFIFVRKFPYVIYYRELTATSVMVYAIAHGRRRPGYWLRRLNRP
jgi:toxin ParE1/3/4